MEDSNALEITENEAYEQLLVYIRGKVTLNKRDEARILKSAEKTNDCQGSSTTIICGNFSTLASLKF
jgi:hypothetical protein